MELIGLARTPGAVPINGTASGAILCFNTPGLLSN